MQGPDRSAHTLQSSWVTSSVHLCVAQTLASGRQLMLGAVLHDPGHLNPAISMPSYLTVQPPPYPATLMLSHLNLQPAQHPTIPIPSCGSHLNKGLKMSERETMPTA